MDRNSLTFTDNEIQEQLKSSNHLLTIIDEIVDWSRIRVFLQPTDSRNKSHYGRDCYNPESILRVLIIKELYCLSDRQTEENIRYNILYKWFCKLSFNAPVPDHATICRWRERFIQHNIFEKIFKDFYLQLNEKGYGIKKGTVIDATIVKSVARPRKTSIIDINKSADESAGESDVTVTTETSKDPDATYKIKGKKIDYGYQVTAATDENGVIMYLDTTPANEYDGSQLPKIIKEIKPTAGTTVYADKGYSSAINRECVTTNKLKDGIMIKKAKNKDMTEEDKEHNKAISEKRYVVERAFGTMKRRLNFARSIYFGLRRTYNRNLFIGFIHNLLRAPNLPRESCVQS